MASRSSLISILLVLAPALSIAFAVPKSSGALFASSKSQSVRSRHLSATNSRRSFIEQFAIVAGTVVIPPLPSHAKESAPPVTRQLVTETFDAIRTELSSPTGVVSTLKSLIDKGSFEDILEYTKESDAYFRRAKLGKARKLLTDKELKGESVLMSNAVTWDLIGINRASRPGKEDREEQLKYLEELKSDVAKFLELEKTIDVVEE